MLNIIEALPGGGYQTAAPFYLLFNGNEADNVLVIEGERFGTGSNVVPYSYSFALSYIFTGGGDDVVYLTNVSAIDPSSTYPNLRQTIDLGSGNDWLTASTLTGIVVFAGEGDDIIVHTDLREASGTRESGTSSGPSIFPPVGLRTDPNWALFNDISLGEGNNQAYLGSGNDWVTAGSGSDFVSLGLGNNFADTGSGNDTIIVAGLQFFAVNGQLSASVRYGPGTNTVFAGDGDDIVTVTNIEGPFGSGFAVNVNGGSGNDIITLDNVNSPAFISGGAGNDTISIDSPLISGGLFPRFGELNDFIFAGEGDDIIYAGHGEDTIVAGTGHDWVFSEQGADTIYLGPVGGAGDAQTDRLSFIDMHRDGNLAAPEWRVDIVYDFQPQSRFGADSGKGDVLDVSALLSELGLYDNNNPFAQGELRLVDEDGLHTIVEFLFPGNRWVPFVKLIGVTPDELDITDMADVTGGLGTKTGGDFLWFTDVPDAAEANFLSVDTAPSTVKFESDGAWGDLWADQSVDGYEGAMTLYDDFAGGPFDSPSSDFGLPPYALAELIEATPLDDITLEDGDVWM